ncbi:MAG: type VI secretion system ATPase TssH [Planctomycetes bacterium]|nr:type VI secretion system ATPase TssH [Planctomycetota bacterium]
MMPVDLKALVGKLGEIPHSTIQGALGLCATRTNYSVEIEHWLLKILDTPNSDAVAVLKHYGVDAGRVMRDLVRSLDRLKTGNSRAPSLSPDVVDLARNAWVSASVDFGATRIRTGHIMYALLADETFRRAAREASPEFEKIPAEQLLRDLPALLRKGSESDGVAAADSGAPAAAGEDGAQRAAPGSKTPALDQFTIDLTARAKRGELDPIIGRDPEIRQVIDILTRRRQNNPILTGEAGVGKTAVVEGFAQRIASGDVPPPLQGVSLRTLDLGLLQAGAGMKGEFENRLKQVIQEVKSSVQPIILFIDEAHTLVGAGGAAGQGDAANLIKPALARGELRTVAATTWAEYKKYFERDAALARRFQVVKVEEPDEANAIHMMRGLVESLERHHNVRVLDEAVADAVKLSHRYVAGRQLPDKSVSVLDTACARVALSQTAVQPAVEDARRDISRLELAIAILQREEKTGADRREDITRLEAELVKARAELVRLDAQVKIEKDLVAKIRAAQYRLAGENPGGSKGADGKPLPAPKPPTAAEADALRVELTALRAELAKAQGEEPLVHVNVDRQAVAEVISAWTGIPVGRMVSDEIRAVLHIRERLEERVVGQSHALEAIAQSIRTSRANLTDPNRPIGVYLMVGTSGVGKTETAIAIAEELYGGEQNMTVINMSEFKEEHKVSLLMGSPPGYVGYGEGGVLTEAVRRKPYSVVLLDEMEKAHPGVQDVFYQVFDKGNMRDGEGRDIDFRNTVILMTSNAGTDAIMKLCADPETMPGPEALNEALRPELLKVFKPAFLGRVTTVTYFPLKDEVMRKIIELKLGKIRRRVEQNYRARFEVAPEVVQNVLDRCREVESGARNVDHILTRTMLPEMAGVFLSRMAEGLPIRNVRVGITPQGGFSYDLS